MSFDNLKGGKRMKDDNNCDDCGGCKSSTDDKKLNVSKQPNNLDWICSFCAIKKKVNNRIMNFGESEVDGYSVCSGCIDDHIKELQDGEAVLARGDQICSFCLKGKHDEVDVYSFISVLHTELYVCENCICEQKYKLDNGVKEREERVTRRIQTPKTIRKILDDYVIGQDRIKVVISNSLNAQEHLIAANKIKLDSEEVIERDNILVIGPTGCGKTLLFKILRKKLNKIVVSGDANTFSEAGYIGADIENLFTTAIVQANGNMEEAQGAIIHIDEVDKIAEKKSDHGDVSRLPVQQALLTPLEGAIIYVPKGFDRKSSEEKVEFDTSQVLFVATGAFYGLDKIIRESSGEKVCGFGAKLKNLYLTSEELADLVDNDVLLAYGLSPEFLGRFHLIVVMHELTTEQYLRVLKEPKNSLVWQFTKRFSLRKKTLEFDDEALELVAEKAKVTKSGARALRGILLKLTRDIYYEMEDDPADVVGYRLTVDSYKRGTLDKIYKKKCSGQCGPNCCAVTGGECCGGDGHDKDGSKKSGASR